MQYWFIFLPSVFDLSRESFFPFCNWKWNNMTHPGLSTRYFKNIFLQLQYWQLKWYHQYFTSLMNYIYNCITSASYHFCNIIIWHLKNLLRHPYALHCFEQIFMEALYHYGNIYRTLVGLVKTVRILAIPQNINSRG